MMGGKRHGHAEFVVVCCLHQLAGSLGYLGGPLGGIGMQDSGQAGKCSAALPIVRDSL